ncbi:hypothetical protein ACFX2G_031757 [Malus domestica]
MIRTSIKGDINAPGLHEHKRQHQRSLPARAETATRHQMLLVRTSLNCTNQMLLVRTSLNCMKQAPCLQEPKLQDTRLLARTSLNCMALSSWSARA